MNDKLHEHIRWAMLRALLLGGTCVYGLHDQEASCTYCRVLQIYTHACWSQGGVVRFPFVSAQGLTRLDKQKSRSCLHLAMVQEVAVGSSFQVSSTVIRLHPDWFKHALAQAFCSGSCSTVLFNFEYSKVIFCV